MKTVMEHFNAILNHVHFLTACGSGKMLLPVYGGAHDRQPVGQPVWAGGGSCCSVRGSVR